MPANSPFSDEFWWLKLEQQTDDKKKRDKLKKDVFGKEGYKNRIGRFGRGTSFTAPSAGDGDYAFILHILASLTDQGRIGGVCPQGLLFRGQPEIEEETGEFDDDGNPIVKRHKADDELLIRQALWDSHVIDAVISLPLNLFYGADVPACLLILQLLHPWKPVVQLASADGPAVRVGVCRRPRGGPPSNSQPLARVLADGAEPLPGG